MISCSLFSSSLCLIMTISICFRSASVRPSDARSNIGGSSTPGPIPGPPPLPALGTPPKPMPAGPAGWVMAEVRVANCFSTSLLRLPPGPPSPPRAGALRSSCHWPWWRMDRHRRGHVRIAQTCQLHEFHSQKTCFSVHGCQHWIRYLNGDLLKPCSSFSHHYSPRVMPQPDDNLLIKSLVNNALTHLLWAHWLEAGNFFFLLPLSCFHTQHKFSQHFRQTGNKHLVISRY